MERGLTELWINFGTAGNSGDYRRAGWSQPEPRHTWTIGRESALELPRPSEPGTYRLAIALAPFVRDKRLPAQHLSVAVNGVVLDTFEVREIGLLECTVPWSLLEGRNTASVTFAHPNAARPSDLTGAPDHREIAFAFETLRFSRRPDDAAAPRPGSAGADLARDQLMMQFESLGENCEFGLAQRRCGAEPLGLLRFASSPIDKLLTGLVHRFEGIGDDGKIEVKASGDGSEYLVIDRCFGFLYHPWVLVGEAEPDFIREREAKRLPFLRRKLLEDLEDGRKIFVYHGMERLAEADMRRLSTAVHAYGPSTLLWVELNDEEHRAGSVEPIAPGLLKGYIDRFAPGENAHDLSLDCWVEICRNAHRLAGVAH